MNMILTPTSDCFVMSLMAHKRILFAHDGPLEVSPDGIPLEVHYSEALLQRYSQLGSKLTFLMRTKPLSASEALKYSPLIRSGFSFQSVKDAKGPIKFACNAWSARKTVRTAVSKHDVVVARLPSLIGSWAFMEARRQGIPVLVEFVACTWDCLWNLSKTGKLTAPYFFLKNKMLMRYSTHTIYVTEQFLQSRYPSNQKFIACSDVELISSSVEVINSRINRISSYNNQRPIILTTVGAIDVPFKGQATVIQALALMGKLGVRYKYRIVGQGDSTRLLNIARELGILPLIEFTGPVPHSDIVDILDNTDIYIQPSKTEGLPRALIEAMSRACPALGSNVGGIPELLSSSRIFDKGDIHRLVEMLSCYSQDLMMHDAVQNWNTAKKYDKEVLAIRRAIFINEFLLDIDN